ncbi:MAG: phasin family protein [Acidobacteria bacterium]|nr:MAG: phasin family protein [Acidobacteriota bacterium]
MPPRSIRPRPGSSPWLEIQSQYAKKAYDTWVAEASKLSEMYAGMARNAYKPVEQAVTKRAPKTASLS